MSTRRLVALCVPLLAGCNEDALHASIVDSLDAAGRDGQGLPPDISLRLPDISVRLPDFAVPVIDMRAPVDVAQPPGPDLSMPPPPIRFAAALYQGGSGAARSLFSADVNGDGLRDVITVGNDLAVTLGFNSQTTRFRAPLDTVLPAGTHAGAFADFDRDKKLDVAVTNESSNAVIMMMGVGDGSFSTGPSFIVGVSPQFVLAADFNVDGKTDLASANFGDGTVSVLLGNGDGTFAAPVALKAGNGPRGLAVGDFNADKQLDIAAANANSSDVSVMLGNGNGTFLPATNYVTGPSPALIATADFNGDGRSDIVAASDSHASAAVLLASQNGFNAGLSFMLNRPTRGLVTGDWNNDKLPDFAVSNISGQATTVTVFLGNGKNNFAATTSPPLPSNGTGPLLTVDFDNAAGDDLIAATIEGASSLLLNDGMGNFAMRLIPTTAGHGFACPGDLNNDGKRDLVALYASGGVQHVAALQGTGDGRFVIRDGARYPIPDESVLAVGDLNGDKNVDVVAMPTSNQGNGASLLGNGDGTLKPALDNQVMFAFNTLGSIGLLDGDGRLDLVGTTNAMPLVQIWRGMGDGTFQKWTTMGAVTYGYPIIADWNNDKVQDVGTIAAAQAVTIFTNKGAGTFAGGSFLAGAAPIVLVAADFNGDGWVDVAVLNGGGFNLGVVLAQPGGGGFTAPVNYGMGLGARWLVAADLNNDGRIDLATAGANGVNVLAGKGDGTFLPQLTLPLAHQSGVLQATDLTGDGKPELVSAGSPGPWLAVYLNMAP